MSRQGLGKWHQGAGVVCAGGHIEALSDVRRTVKWDVGTESYEHSLHQRPHSQVVKSLRKFGFVEKGDERILGSGDFVEGVIQQADEKIKHQLPAKDLKKETAALISRECKKRKMNVAMLRSGSRLKEVSWLRTSLRLNW